VVNTSINTIPTFGGKINFRKLISEFLMEIRYC
jgi:hypothetical protein